MLKYTLPNGETLDVPPEVAGAEDYAKATQGFYDGQAQRVALELGITVADLHSAPFAKDPAGFVAAHKAAAAAADAQAPAPSTIEAPATPAAGA